MKIYILLLVICISLFGFAFCMASSYINIIKPLNENLDNRYAVANNLAEYYDICLCEITDSSLCKTFSQDLTKFAENIYPTYKKLNELKDLKWQIFKMSESEDLVLFFSSGNDLVHPLCINIAYNQKAKKYFNLNEMGNDEVNELLEAVKVPYTAPHLASFF